MLFAIQDPCLTLGLPLRTNGQVQFQLQGETGVSYVIETSTNLQSWIPVSTNTQSLGDLFSTIAIPESFPAAFVRASRGLQPMFTGAVTTRSNITFKGNEIRVDSYDSMDPNHSSTNGLYDPAKRKPVGDVKSEMGLIDIGNAQINGKLKTGPYGAVSVGASGSVGDLNWNDPGIQPGWHAQNFQFCLPDIQWSFFGPEPMGAGTNKYILGTGDFTLPLLGLAFGESMLVVGNARLYVSGNVLMQGNSSIVIVEGSSLTLVAAGASTALTKVNTWGNVNTFHYYGLVTNTNFSWTGNNAYIGTVYAPQAAITLNGGGTPVKDFQGAIVARSLSISGSFNFHFDEALIRRGPKR
jgi:hypothetical protein